MRSLGTLFAAATYFIGNLVFYQYPLQLVAAPIVGALLGLLAAVQVVRSKKLPIFVTLREYRIAVAHDNQGGVNLVVRRLGSRVLKAICTYSASLTKST